MVRLHPLRRRSGRRGKLTGDSDVEYAAVALLLGYSDPLGLLATHPEDVPILNAVVQRAQKLRRDQIQDIVNALRG